MTSSFFLWINTRPDLLAKIEWSVCILKSQRIFGSHFPGQILVYVYIICQLSQIFIFCINLCGSPFPPSCTKSCDPFVPVDSICLLLLLSLLFTPCELFIPILAGGLSLESEWYQVSSCLQYSCHFQQCWSLVLILSLISNFSSPFFKYFGTAPSIPTTIGITITLMFYSIFSSLARSKYLSIFLLSFIFTLWYTRMPRSTKQWVHFVFVN